MIDSIIEACNKGQLVTIILRTKEKIKLYENPFELEFNYRFDSIEFDEDNLYLITNAGFLSSKKTRIIPASSIADVKMSGS